MLNLLLRKDRYNLRKEYTLRFFNIIFIFGILASVIFMVLLFSISIFVWVENNIISSQLDAVVGSGNTEQREDLEKMTEDINRQIKELQKVRPEYSGFLSEILSVQPQGVGLESINFQPNFSE